MAVPAFILTGALVIHAAFPDMPKIGAMMLHYSLYIMAVVAGLLSWWFNRTRALFAIFIAVIGYVMVKSYLGEGIGDDAAGKIIFPAFAFLSVINFLIFSLLEERGIITVHGLIRLGLLLVQIFAILFVANYAFKVMEHNDAKELTDAVKGFFGYRFLPDGFDLWTPLPQISLLAFVLVFLGFFGKAAVTGKPMDYSFLIALISLALGLHFAGSGEVAVFFLAVVLVMVAGVVQDSYHMAFHDQLTGIPARQALVADLKKLGGRYAIAMSDIDHFKKFNDTYGHDVGDQVLRMVASHLRGVTGGGKAYRYGGEEFTIVFAGKGRQEALEHLERLRKNIAEAGFKIRSDNRPEDEEKAKELRGRNEAEVAKIVSVTISMGVAEKGRSDSSPEDVIKKADTALYKAKKEGRNRVVAG